MNQSLDKRWGAVQIKPNSYLSAIQNLERQGFEIFLPKMEITQRKENKFVYKNVYVFPGYMFVCFGPHTVSWTKINSTFGVSKILTFSSKPVEIPSDLILELKKKYTINRNLTQKEKLQKGDYIKFYAGPFTDLIAEIESIDEKNRIWVLMETIGGNKKLKLQNVEKNRYHKL